MLSGYFAVFGRWARIEGEGGYPFMEQIAKGAFERTMAENSLMRCLYGHGRDHIVGMKPLGPISELHEDEHGTRISSSPTHTRGAR